jgi:hypothetical protein
MHPTRPKEPALPSTSHALPPPPPHKTTGERRANKHTIARASPGLALPQPREREKTATPRRSHDCHPLLSRRPNQEPLRPPVPSAGTLTCTPPML